MSTLTYAEADFFLMFSTALIDMSMNFSSNMQVYINGNDTPIEYYLQVDS